MDSLIVLVHSPLVGPATWEAAAGILRERGCTVIVPDLTGALEGGAAYWPRQASAVVGAVLEAVSDVGGQRAVLVGHSGAGPLLPATGRAMGEAVGTVAGYVFVDAGLPTPGQSWLDTAPVDLANQLRAMTVDGWLPPWSRWWGEDGLNELLPDPQLRARVKADCPPLPFAMFEEPKPSVAGWPETACSYLLLSDGYRDEADRSRELGWPTIELPLHHLSLLTDPTVVADALLELVEHSAG